MNAEGVPCVIGVTARVGKTVEGTLDMMVSRGSVLQSCVAVWCSSVVQCVVQRGAAWCSVVQCGAVWCSVVHCGAVCCSVVI